MMNMMKSRRMAWTKFFSWWILSILWRTSKVSAISFSRNEEAWRNDGGYWRESSSTSTAYDETQHSDQDTMEALLAAPVLTNEGSPQSKWVTKFCDAVGHELFCPIPTSFITEEFNWLNITYDIDAIDHITGARSIEDIVADDESHHRNRSTLFASARHMYGLIHSRYIVTQKGLVAMREQYEAGHFGYCPRVLCQDQNLLPVGQHEDPLSSVPASTTYDDEHSVKVYCPRCQEVYHPPPSVYHRNLDGAYWGTSFPHLFLLAFPELRPSVTTASSSIVRGRQQQSAVTTRKKAEGYGPRVFGFRLSMGGEEREEELGEKEEDYDEVDRWEGSGSSKLRGEAVASRSRPGLTAPPWKYSQAEK